LPERRLGRLLTSPQLYVGRVLDPASQCREFGANGIIVRRPHDFIKRSFPHRNGKFPIKRYGSMLHRIAAPHKRRMFVSDRDAPA
jgi:hypothetical protein